MPRSNDRDTALDEVGRSPTSASKRDSQTSSRSAESASPSFVAVSRAETSGPRRSAPSTLASLEIDGDGRIAAYVVFDPDDIDAAIAELDARYLAGEAAPYARRGRHGCDGRARRSSIDMSSAGRCLADWVTSIIDESRFGSDDYGRAIEAAVDDSCRTPRYRVDCGARATTLTSTRHQSSLAPRKAASTPNGNELQWSRIRSTVDPINRGWKCLTKHDVDAALARFEDFSPPGAAGKCGKPSVRALEARLVARDWDAMADMLADDFLNDDRRRIVNAGIRHGRDAVDRRICGRSPKSGSRT